MTSMVRRSGQWMRGALLGSLLWASFEAVAAAQAGPRQATAAREGEQLARGRDVQAPGPEEQRKGAAERGAEQPSVGQGPQREEATGRSARLRAGLRGAYEFRANWMGDVPLYTIERTGYPPVLGQNKWLENWLRLRLQVAYEGPRGPDGRGWAVRLLAEADVVDGLIGGDLTQGVTAAARPRADVLEQGFVEPRQLAVEVLSPIGLLRAGLQTSHWGLGILANGGDVEPPFGDYRYGDRVLRLLFATKPLGPRVPFYAAVLGDLVYDDLIATLGDDERAWQGTVALFYREERERPPEHPGGSEAARAAARRVPERFVGFYGVYRSQSRPIESLGRQLPEREWLRVAVADLFARWWWPEPTGGWIVLSGEGAFVFGRTNFTRSVERDQNAVRQWIAAVEAARLAEPFDVYLEFGYTSGDANPDDAVVRRGTMDPDYRVGLILFPELLAWQTARSATLARSELLFARPAPGTDLLPSNGGVFGAMYLFPRVYWRLPWLPSLELRLGAVWARATAAVADPFRQRAESRSVNYNDGDARARDLGVELDGAIRYNLQLPKGIVLHLGIEGGVLFPGAAFDDAMGRSMDPLGMGRLRLGLRF